MVNQLVEAMKIGEEKARQEMEVASHDNPIFIASTSGFAIIKS